MPSLHSTGTSTPMLMPARWRPALRQTVRETEPGAFDARAIRDLLASAAPTDPKHDCGARSASEATSDRPAGGLDDLRTKRRGEFPQRFYPHRALRGGTRRGDGLATEPAAGWEQRGEEGAGAGRSDKGASGRSA